MASVVIRGPKVSRAIRAEVSKFPRNGQHGGYDPAAYPLLWVAMDGPTPVAYANARPDDEDPGVLHLRGCYVRPEYRGRGLQSRLLRRRLGIAKRRGFRVVRTYAVVTNAPSLVNLLRAGFVPERVTEGCLILERKL